MKIKLFIYIAIISALALAAQNAFSFEKDHWFRQVYFMTKVSNYMHYASIFNTLWPRDAIWRHRSGSTLAQVMA